MAAHRDKTTGSQRRKLFRPTEFTYEYRFGAGGPPLFGEYWDAAYHAK